MIAISRVTGLASEMCHVVMPDSYPNWLVTRPYLSALFVSLLPVCEYKATRGVHLAPIRTGGRRWPNVV